MACFDRIEKIGEEVSETLDYAPAKLTVIEHVRIKYVCKKDAESAVRTAAAQPSPLPKSNASAGLLAQVLVSTFADHLPLNRQEAIFKRHGMHLPRATLCEWKLAAAELLAVLQPALKAHILAAPRVHSDDTTMPDNNAIKQVIRPIAVGRSNYLFAGSARGGDDVLVDRHGQAERDQSTPVAQGLACPAAIASDQPGRRVAATAYLPMGMTH
jgi:transposase